MPTTGSFRCLLYPVSRCKHPLFGVYLSDFHKFYSDDFTVLLGEFDKKCEKETHRT